MGDSSDRRDKHVNETIQQEEKKKCENWFVKNQQGFRIKLEIQTNKTTSIFCGMSALSQVALYKFKMHSDHTVGLPYVCLLSLLHNFSCFSRFFLPNLFRKQFIKIDNRLYDFETLCGWKWLVYTDALAN